MRVEKIAQNENYPLEIHLDDFEEFLESKGTTDDHIAKTVGYVKEIIDACGFKIGRDIDAWRVSEYLLRLRRDGKAIMNRWGEFLRRKPQSVAAINGKITAIKSFTCWLYRNDRMRTDSLKSLRQDAKGERANKVHARRALSDEEIYQLLQTTLAGPDYRGNRRAD